MVKHDHHVSISLTVETRQLAPYPGVLRRVIGDVRIHCDHERIAVAHGIGGITRESPWRCRGWNEVAKGGEKMAERYLPVGRVTVHRVCRIVIARRREDRY